MYKFSDSSQALHRGGGPGAPGVYFGKWIRYGTHSYWKNHNDIII